mgnify:FL=1
MFIKVIITKFPNDNKKQLALAFITAVAPKFQNDSKLLNFQILDIGEGKILNIAKYNSKKNFEETNKWLQPLFTKMTKELDGVVESIPGEVVFGCSRQINKV